MPKKNIYYGRQFIDRSDVIEVSKSLKNDLITTGDYVKKFEKKIKNFLNVKYAATCSNGTSALHLSFLASDIKKGDVVIMPIINFISSYNMCKLLGAKIFFADVDKQSGLITPDAIIRCIKLNKLKKVKAFVVQYMGGFPDHNEKFYKLKKKLKCLLIEDACHAFGAKYTVKKKLYKIGSCKHADISTFSFHPLKPITTGEGGCVTTNNKKIFEKIIKFRSHGMTRDKKKHWNYDIETIGFNYRLSDINCALGLSQINKLNFFINKRKKIYNYYKLKLNNYKNLISFPKYNNKNYSSFHLVLINLNFKNLIKKNNFLNYMVKNKIFCQYHYIPLNKFSLINTKAVNLNDYKTYFLQTVSIPIHHHLSFEDIKYVVDKIKKYFS
jgi:dTDP-4-amino-4,6-dideoxygalactose transaminase